jgi:hypothetical protein
MKKTALAVFVTGALGVSAANAATVTEFANGVLVPRVITDQASPDVGQTAIGLNSCAAGTVYWTFFDVDSVHVLDDQFDMTANDQANLVWNVSENPGTGRLFGGQDVEGEEGYLVFIFDTTGDAQLQATVGGSSDEPCLAGAAFQVHLGDNDVAFVPTMPLNIRPIAPGVVAGDFNEEGGPGTGVFIDDLTAMDNNDIARLTAGASANDVVFLRYLVDGAAGGDDTAIYVWSTTAPGTTTVQMFDDNQNRRSVNISLPNVELNVINPETVVGRPPTFIDGFIEWEVPSTVAGAISWSVIDSPAFGARQTIVNPIRLMDASGASAFRIRVIENAAGSVPAHSLELLTD